LGQKFTNDLLPRALRYRRRPVPGRQLLRIGTKAQLRAREAGYRQILDQGTQVSGESVDRLRALRTVHAHAFLDEAKEFLLGEYLFQKQRDEGFVQVGPAVRKLAIRMIREHHAAYGGDQRVPGKVGHPGAPDLGDEEVDHFVGPGNS
jgi:hypothetical protein